MEKKTKIRIMTGIAVLAVATGLSLSSPQETYMYENKTRYNETVKELLSKVYVEEDIEVDDQFVMAYLEAEKNAFEEADNHMSKEYYPESVITSDDEYFELTEWIPTVEEVQAFYSKVKNK